MASDIPFCPECNSQNWHLEEQYETAQYYYTLTEEGWVEDDHCLDDNIDYYTCNECDYAVERHGPLHEELKSFCFVPQYHDRPTQIGV